MHAALWRAGRLPRHLVLLLVGVGRDRVVLTQVVSDYQDYQLAQLGAYVCAAAGLTVLTGTQRPGLARPRRADGGRRLHGGAAADQVQRRRRDAGSGCCRCRCWSARRSPRSRAPSSGWRRRGCAARTWPARRSPSASHCPAITSHYSSFFKGDQGLFVPFDGPPAGLGYDFTLQHWQAWISLGAALLVLFFLANLKRSAVGRHMRAVRDDEIAAALVRALGRRASRSAPSRSAPPPPGSAAASSRSALQTASPGLVRPGALARAALRRVIGGLGSLAGAVWGSLIVVFLSSFITDHVDSLGLLPTRRRAAERQPRRRDLRPAAGRGDPRAARRHPGPAPTVSLALISEPATPNHTGGRHMTGPD